MRITLEKDGQTQLLDTEKDADRISTLKAQGWVEKAEKAEHAVESAAKGEEKVKQ
jgi:very-short-patch-repair endonuclease